VFVGEGVNQQRVAWLGWSLFAMSAASQGGWDEGKEMEVGGEEGRDRSDVEPESTFRHE